MEKFINNNLIYYSATSLQNEIYFSHIKNEDKTKFNISKMYNIKNIGNIIKLKEGFKEIFRKNELLRSKFSVIKFNDENKVFYTIDDECTFDFEYYTNENYKNFVRYFDLSKSPLIRVGFIENHTLMIDIHRIVVDSISFNIMINELINYYKGEISLDPSTQFSDYINEYYQDQNKINSNIDLKFINDMFNNDYNILNLPKKDKYIKISNNKKITKNYSLTVNGEIYKDLKNFINGNFNPYSFFLSIYGLIMNRYSEQEYIYTSILNNRRNKIIKNIIGEFDLIQPLLININNKKLLNNLIDEVDSLLSQYDENKILLSNNFKNSNLLSFNNIFIYNSIALLKIRFNPFIEEIEKIDIDNNKNDFNLFINKLYNFDIIFKVTDYEDNYRFTIEYNGNLYDDKIIKNIMKSYLEVIKNKENLYKNIIDIDYITPKEKKRILYNFNNNIFDYGEKFYHVELSKVAKSNPNKIMLIFNNIEFTYSDIDHMSNSLAYYLRMIGIKRNEVVPVISERSYHYIIACLAVMKAGGAFLYIDPEFPKERIKFMISEVKAKIILEYTPNQSKGNLFDFIDDSIIQYKLENHDYNKNINDIPNINKSDDISCVFFTSGTTGKPKGILINHDNLVNSTIYALTTDQGQKSLYENPGSILAFTKFSYVVCLMEIFYPLINQINIILCDEKEYIQPDLLADIITKYKIGLAGGATTRFRHYLNNEKFRKSVINFKVLVFGGESLTRDFLEILTKYTNALIYYSYGSTETTAFTAISYISKDDVINHNTITIGKPDCNVQIYILGNNLKPVPIGVEGEIYVAGYGICNGYLNLDELNNKTFVDCPFHNNLSKKTKMYKTGDIGKWTNDGRIIHLGRKDFQVKIRGQRIELTEIEQVVKEIKEIKFTVVIDKCKSKTNEKYLACYYIADCKIDGNYIRNYLSKKLPLYMIPSCFIQIEKIPVNAHGKFDRKSLPDPDIDNILINHYVSPETHTEKVLCKIYSKVFNINEDKIGKNSNFFELGGDSLLAIKVLGSIEMEFNVRLNIKDILNYSILHDLGKYIKGILNKGDHNNETFKLERIEKRDSKEFPITSQQLGIYIDSIKNPDSIIYNNPIAFHLKKNVDITKIKDGFCNLLNNQEILKSKYYEKEINNKFEIYGIIDDECDLIFESYTYENAQSFIRPFDLSKAPLIRVGFINDEILLMDIHHIISDGTTMVIIQNELSSYYRGEYIKELDIQFKDYAIYLNEQKYNNYYFKQIEYYRKMFNCEYELLNISKKNNVIKRASMEDNIEKGRKNIGICNNIINKELSKKIDHYTKNNKISKTAFFLSAYGYVLSKYSGQNMIYTSLMSTNRNNRYVDDMIGMFVTTLPLLLRYDDEKINYLQNIKNNMNTLMDVYQNSDISFSELQNSLKLKKINNSFVYQPKSIFHIDADDIMFENYKDLSSNFESKNMTLRNDNTKFDITILVYENNDNYTISLEYNNELYESELMYQILNSYIEIIKNIDQYQQKINSIEYIPKSEIEKVIYNFNKDTNKNDCEKLYHEEFNEIANKYPEKCAIVYNDIRINYRELNEMSNSLAHYIRESGIKRNDIIPIISDRSPYYLISMLAVSKSGGTFLPVNKKLPIERIQFILEEVKPKIILYSNTQNIIDELLLINENYKVYDVQQHEYKLNTNSIENINEPEDVCYVLFTSGTTGKPKGTLISHFNIFNYVKTIHGNENIYCMYNLFIKECNIQNLLGFCNFSFDASHNETINSLIHGLTLVLVDDEIGNNISSLSKYILKNNVDFINTTPSVLKVFMDNEEFRKCVGIIKVIVLGGEALSIDLCKYIHQYSNCKVYNQYGPTECTIACSCKLIDEVNNNKINIGKPLCNSKMYILDKYLKPVPIGVEGEIFIGGYGVGKGYLKHESLTKEKFIENPFNFDNDEHNKIMYRTGDLGKWTQNGEIEYLGRTDFQVKINGQRIELGEIEGAVNEIDQIKQNVVIDKINKNGNKYLICYYISKKNINIKNIQEYLKKKLPQYMIPNYFKRIEKFELTNNDKLDRKTLPEPDINDLIKEEYVSPETEIEKIVCGIYSRLFNLNEKEIGRNNNFFELGGNSLNAIRLVSMIEKELKIKMTIKEIFENSYIVDLSSYIEKLLKNNNNTRNVEVIKKHNSKEFPITSQQLGVYIDSIKNENTVIYNTPSSFKLKENVDIEKIKKGFNLIFQNQEILKTKYYSKEINGKEEIYGFIDDECILTFEEYSYDNASSFIRPFNLSKAPLIRIGFIEKEYLLIDMHHIISDGATTLIIMNELNKYYHEGDISELEIQYSDYAIDMQEKENNGFFDKQIEFYKEIFNNEYELVNLPEKDNTLTNNTNINRNTNYSRNINKTTSNIINEFIKNQGISKTSFFFVIYGFVLSKYSGQDIIYTSILNANRNNHYVENMAGMFVSTLPILLKYNNENNSFLEIIKKNMDILINIFSNQNISLAELTNKLKLKRMNNLFVFQPEKSINDLLIKNEIFDKEGYFDSILTNNKVNKNSINISKFDIEFKIIENRNDYLISIDFNNNIYDDIIIENIIDSFMEIINNINKFNNKINDIEYISQKEKQKIINEFNSDIFVSGSEKLYHEEFSKFAKQYPDKCAIVYNDVKTNYRKLNEMSNSLAHYIRECGIKRNDIVPIISNRSPYYIISMLAVSKAGGAFLPIDPKLPVERIQLILEDVNPKMILYNNTKNIIDELLLLNKNYFVYNIEKHNYTLNITSIDNVNKPDDICYVIFTSGTTGKPKGALISHFNIFNFVRTSQGNEKNYYVHDLFIKNNNIQNVLGILNFSFDASHMDTINSLVHGLNLVLVDEDMRSNISSLSKYILENNVEFIKMTPTILKIFMDNDEFRKSVYSIKAILLGGEPLSVDLCKFVHQYSDCLIYNEYGPTECTVACTGKLIDEENDNKINIGKPFCNYRIYILDKYLKPVPIGVEGEIYIGGYGVGKGYINHEELTNEKFVSNPFNYENDEHNKIIYKTGDLGKWTKNGEIEYIGRTDFQVKIHGQRIELSEIECLVNEMKEIKHGIVIDKMKFNGEKYLVCYYQLYDNENNTSEIKGKDIRKYLKSKLPSYMIPNYYKRLYEIPLTVNGKLNRKMLPEINIGDIIKDEYIAPETKIEKSICHMYSKLFNINENEIGKVSDFFELGGDSLSAIKFISMIEKKFKVKLNIKNIYENSLIVDLSSYIEKILMNNKNSKNIEVIKKLNRKEFPVTSQQLGVYIDSIKNENTIIYNIPQTHKLNKDVDIEKIKKCFNEIFQNQEIFRTKYYSKEINGKEEIYGFIDDKCTLEFEEYTYDNVSSFVRPFNLSKAPLIRVGFIGNEYLLIDTHHIISDGSTTLIIMNELNKYYHEGNISKLEIQYSDYAINMKEKQNNGYYDKQIEFYKEMFNTNYELVSIPKKENYSEKNITNEEMDGYNINNYSRIIDSSKCEIINEFIENQGISKTSFFLTIYGFILSKYSGQDIIYTSIINANRNNYYSENMAGMFVSTLPILLKYNNENDTIIESFKNTMETLINIFSNQNISLSVLSQELKLKTINNSFIFHPRSAININYLNKYKQNSILSPNINNNLLMNEENIISKFDLEFSITENENYDYLISVNYNNKLYDHFIIENIIDNFVELASSINEFKNKIKDIEYISFKEKQKINEFNSDMYVDKNEQFYHEEFDKIVKQYPDKCAIIYNDIKINYRELDEMSNSLAHYIRKTNIGRNDIIPIISNRSPYFIISMLAVSKAGGAFLAVDPKLPIERIQLILRDVNPKMILYYNTQNVINDLLLLNKNYNAYDVKQHNYELNTNYIENINEPYDTCYVLFTSGTTGKPKGALVNHFNIYNNIRKFDEENLNNLGLYNLIKKQDANNILGIGNFSFDIIHMEITVSLIHGFTIVLIDDIISENIELLSNTILKNNVEVITTTPTRFKLFMEYEKFRKCISNIKVITLAGEALSVDLCKNIHQYSNCKIFNAYGPTECAVTSTLKEIDSEDENVTIGKPQCNYKIYILDKYLKHVPIGVEGEICIGGYGVGKGYLNREDLTNEKFIENPFNFDNDKHNKIMYRTGDLGKWTLDGEIQYLGRIDLQVKIHGQRIELGEIESLINEMKEIKHGIVIDKEKSNGEKYLVCYYQLYDNDTDRIEGKDIRKYLKNKLPVYMIPNYYKNINEIPLTISGKLNRKELPEINIKDIVKDEYIEPETEIEKRICHMYSKIFNINENEIGKTNDFFELGGDSLNAIRLISMIEKELKLKLSIKEIYENSLIVDLCSYIEDILKSNNNSRNAEVIKKCNSKEFPITSQQLGIYIDSIKNENTIIYNIPSSFKLNEGINIEKIKEGFNEIIQNQEIFRTKYYSKEINGKEEIYGFIDDECILIFEEYSYDNASSFIRPFDLSKAPLIRIGFINNEYLLVDMHHIISDGATSLIIMNELNKYYNEGNISKLEIQYSDYAIDMKEKQNNGFYDKQIEFYKEIFKTEYELYSGQGVIYTSIMNANRENHYNENMAGMFVSTLPLLLKYNDNENDEKSISNYIKDNSNTLFEIYNNKNISFSELINSLKLKRMNNSFIFQPKAEYLNFENNILFDENEEEYSLEMFNYHKNYKNNSKFDIVFIVKEKRENYIVSVEYNPNIYDNNIINNLVNSYLEILNHIDDFDKKSKEIEYIPENEKEKIIKRFNCETYKSGCEKFYHEAFSKIAKKYSEKCAIIYNDIYISYKELDELSNSLAHYLRANGINRNDIIPLICDRSPYYIIGMTGISKAGGAFLPIDKKLPIERIQFILEEVNPKMILYNNTQDIINKLTLLNKNHTVYNLVNHNYELNTNSIDNINKSDDLCYVLFTSGTTGKPKGVLISHFNIYNNIRTFDDDSFEHLSIYNLIKKEEINNILGIANFSFDMSLHEITLSLTHGLTFILIDDIVIENIKLLSNIIIKNNVEYICTTPTRFKFFMENKEFRKYISVLKLVILGGEALPIDLCKIIHKYSKCKIFNGYGPTECTVSSSFKEINSQNENKITIGKPICNYTLYILDKYMKPVPIGVEGEIFIGGYGVGKGYLNREDLTNEKFIENPFNFDNDKHNKIMYRTGDLGKWTLDGEIQYLGRIDLQVKIHGQRIELGEIESLINEMKEIKHGIVIDKEKSNGEKYLVCYYQLDDNDNEKKNDKNQIKGKDIRNYLKKKLPPYMIPNYYKKINKIPVNKNGKLNRKELPEINIEDIIKEEYIAPETEIEKRICHMYSKIFNINENEIGKTNDFFELGGDSLNAIRLISMIEKELKIKLNIKEIYDNSLIADLSEYTEEILSSVNESKKIEIIKKYNSKEFPITSQQLGVYIDSIKNENTIIYNLPSSFKLNEGINIEKIKEGFNEIFQNQEILRTKYYAKEVNGQTEIYGFIDDECTLNFEEYNYDNALSFIRPFDLSKAPLIRVGFINNEYLLIDMHHIISDGATSLIIMNELIKYYNEGNISELEVHYSDYAIDMKEKQSNGYYNKQIEFYKEKFDTEYELVNLPKNEVNDRESSNNVKNRSSKSIDKLTTNIINEYIRKKQISKTSFFLTIYGFILSKYSNQNIIYTSIINANRNNHYVENMVGMFVSTLPILLNYDKENYSFIEIVKENMNTLTEMNNNQNLSLAELSKILKLKKINNSFAFQPKVTFNEFNTKENEVFSNERSENKFDMNYYNELNESNIYKFEIDFNVNENENGYLISVTFDNLMYNIEIIDNLIDSFIEVAKNISSFENDIQNIEYIPLNIKQKIINKYNSDIYIDENEKLYHEEFKKTANLYPDKCAIVYNDIKINYRELDKMSNSLAHYIRENGVGRNNIIPIISDRNQFYIISILAISKAGGAFLPIDPKLPIERIQLILEEVNPKIILYSNTQDIINELLILNKNYKVYNIKQHNYKLNIDNIESINEPNDIFYVLFTSGTTGKPKGTLISHFNIFNYIRTIKENKMNHHYMNNLLGGKNNIQNILGISNFSFDASHNETLNSLINGLKLVLVDDDTCNNISSLSNYIIKNNVEFIQTTPSRLKLFMENEEFRKCISIIKVILFGGEALSIDLCKYVHKYSNCLIYNQYGPTECTIGTTMKLINEKTSNKISIGKPYCNCKVYILDKYLKPVPIGVEGEIFIGGYGVGKGYLNREDLTNEKFIENPFNFDNDKHNKIMYRTGDLGKWTLDGEIQYLGRIDLQVKIHGQRIELGEIESLINEMKEIKHGIVIDKEKSNGEKYLVCYYQLNENYGIDEIERKDIRNHLKKKLPPYMIPNYYKMINEIPLNKNGKLNRKELPEINIEDIIKEEYIAPETEIEKRICHMYSKIFNINENEIGKTNDFFELGGDSFNAIKIISEIRKEFNVKINIKDILHNSIISSLAKLIEEIKSNNDEGDDNNNYRVKKIKKYNRDEFPITSILSNSTVYTGYTGEINLETLKEFAKNLNMFVYLKLPNGADIEKINEIFNIIINRHNILKVKFIEKKDEFNNINIYGKIRKNCVLKIEKYNNTNYKEFIRPFDITKDLLIRVGIIEYLNILMIDINHIIGDGFSIGILKKEIFDLYRGEELKELLIQYSDYAIQYDEKINSEKSLNQMKIYEKIFNKPLHPLKFIKKESKSTNENSNEKIVCKSVTVNVDKENFKNINLIIKENNLSKTAFFITIYSLVLSIYSGEKELFFTLLNSNRENEYTENLIGMFIKFLPLLISMEKINLIDLIKKSMKNILILFSDDVPSLKLYNKFNIPKSNLYYQFNPYGMSMENNKELANFMKNIDNIDFREILEEDSIPEIDEERIGNGISFIIDEKKDSYEMRFGYRSSIIDDRDIIEIVTNFLQIIGNKEFLTQNVEDISNHFINNSNSIENIHHQYSIKNSSTENYKINITNYRSVNINNRNNDITIENSEDTNIKINEKCLDYKFIKKDDSKSYVNSVKIREINSSNNIDIIDKTNIIKKEYNNNNNNNGNIKQKIERFKIIHIIKKQINKMFSKIICY
ncbi:acetyl-CoA synthetase-like protein [Anaeromyces robustus]|uniref:Acetyl-CoA synthetase-like protein n=1 Tax=Anaeromyces robustus TaxID=1754192 RepID=A0A1Y1X3X5_9FUNG|nr:acetyl-CoA synthetase-like protein [Anaeromyces robustus]|eukprot:ORX80511.1 acetyl-CoA synthetase-like protein [Anaeromyces robustus]